MDPEHFAIIKSLKQPTNALKSNLLKVLLSRSHDLTWDFQEEETYNITQILWDHLNVGLSELENQLLCSTCFYNILRFDKNKLLFLNKILKYIDHHNDKKCNKSLSENTSTEITLSLIYGLFQSSFLVDTKYEKAEIINILNTSLNVLVLMAYEYSNHTYIVFKIINFFHKLENTEYISEVLNESRQKTLLNIVNNNWENPVNGVRDLNKTLFAFLWRHLDSNVRSKIFQIIIMFKWNKAKYLMLSEILLQYPGSILKLFSENEDLIQGLIASLYTTGLVCAGTDMYNVILSKLNSENEWCSLLLHHINKILHEQSILAINNFSNYWCLITFKKFPALCGTLIRELKLIDCFETNYSSVCLMKQTNRLRLLAKMYSGALNITLLENFLANKLADCNTNLRLSVFEIICTLHLTYIPAKWEYIHVFQFLEDNINSDSTVLRISMLNSLKQFLNKIHVAFLNNSKKSNKSIVDPNLLTFCSNVQTLIDVSLDFKNPNYQRKITCIKICDTFWSCFSEVKKIQSISEKTPKRDLLQALDSAGVWNFNDEKFIQKLLKLLRDPANDIRENVINILLNHYNCILEKSEMFNEFIETGFMSIKSIYFYEISSGHSILCLLANMLVKFKCKNMKFCNIEALFSHIFDTFIEQYEFHRYGIQSLERGIQLHALVNGLIIIIEICIKNSYPIENILNEKKLNQLLERIDEISSSFAREEETVSADFAKMDLMVKDMIMESNCTVNKEDEIKEDEIKISGYYQFVLNCMWLNTKASCDLCAILIRSFTHDCYVEYVNQKCLKIIMNVLETSRHKGVIEAAGSALGIAIRHLSLLSNQTYLWTRTYSLLKCKLNEMLQETSRMASVTRRGAGLSIMIHKIVSSEKNKRKPLFHYFLKMLLDKFYSVQLPQDTEDFQEENERDLPESQMLLDKFYSVLLPQDTEDFQGKNERDLPEAIYIHFLTKIVTDSSLHPDIMCYADRLGQLAFGSLTSEHWQIRNAALQLYGALVPKLLGQKKSCGNNEENIGTVACDEFRTHFPKLWCYIHEQLRFTSSNIKAHSNLVPILNLLAHMAKRYNFDDDVLNSKYVCDNEFLRILLTLLGSPIYTVRYLTSKTIYLNYSLNTIVEQLDLENHCIPENLLHGYLVLTKIFYKNMPNNRENRCFVLLKRYYEGIMTAKKHSYLCRTLYEEMFLTVGQFDFVTKVKNVTEQLLSEIHAPGISSWANLHIKKCVQMSSWDSIPQILNIIMHQKEYEIYCEFLLERVQSETNIPSDVLLQIVELILQCDVKFIRNVLWKILYKISKLTDLSNCSCLKVVFTYLCEIQYVVPYKIRHLIQFACAVTRYIEIDSRTLLQLSNTICQMTDSEVMDVDMRYIAAQAVNEFAPLFTQLDDKIKINLLNAVIILLQDEDENVRNECTIFVQILLKSQHTIQPYVCLRKIMKYDFLDLLFSNSHKSISDLFNNIRQLLHNYDLKLSNKNNDYNPFSNDVRNIYFEPDVLKKYLETESKYFSIGCQVQDGNE